MKTNSMKIRKLQRIFSTGVLSIIILLICPCVFDIPSTEGNNATKLLIVYEKVPVKVNVPKKLIVKAVDDKGRLDTNRDDLIEFNLTSLSYPKPVAKLSQYTLNLVNGTTTLTLIGPLKEMLLITVNWKSSETKLESHSILMQVGGARFC